MPLWGEIYLLKFKGFGSLIQDGQLETVPGMRMHFLDPKLLPPPFVHFSETVEFQQIDLSVRL